jgi:hypothetical protein
MPKIRTELRDILSRCDRVLTAALSVILATASASVGSTWSSHAPTERTVQVIRRVVQEVYNVPPVQISLLDPPADAGRAQVLAEYQCLSEVMYYEARSEGQEGEQAVAEVVFHRIEGGGHGRSICAVVFEGAGSPVCQFSYVCDGSRDKPKEPGAWRAAQLLAGRILTGSQTLLDETEGATNYHAVYVRPVWAAALVRTAQVGKHIFYRPAGGEMLLLQERAFRGSQW